MIHLVAFCCRLILIAASGLLGFAVLVFTFHLPGVLCIGLGLLAWSRQRWKGTGWSHGTASFGNLLTFYRSGFFGTDGLLIGTGGYAAAPRGQALALLFNPCVASRTAVLLFLAAYFRGNWGRQLVVRLRNYVHIAIFAATGRGKGVSFLVPTLLSYPGSMVVVDQKDGELFKLTGEARRKFGRVIRVDGWNVCGEPGSVGFNPLPALDPDADDFLDGCTDLANMNIVRTGREHDGTHFLDMAQNDLASVIAFVRACEPDPAKRNLQTVRDIISNPDRFTQVIELMSVIAPLSRQAHQMRWPKDRERGSIMSTLQRMTGWLDGAAIRAHTSVIDGYEPMELRTPGTTVYLCGASQRTNAASLMRLYLGWTLRRLCENGGDPRRPVLFAIDECGNLGALDALDRATTMVRSAGIHLLSVWQSLGQLRERYGERANTILENNDTQIYFGVNAFDSAEAVSKKAGDQTITVESYNRTTQRSRPDGYGRDSGGGSTSTSTSYTASELGRPLIRPDEIIRMPEDAALIFHRNLPVLPVQLIRYYNSPLFKRGRRGAMRGLSLSAVLATLLAAAFSVLMSVVMVSLAMAPAPTVPAQRPPFPAYRDATHFGPQVMPYSEPWRQRYAPSPYGPNLSPPPGWRERSARTGGGRLLIPIR